MLRVGLVGFGLAGRVFHAPMIRAVEGLRLSTIVQRHGDPAPGYEDVEFVRSVDELLTRPVDLVVVATTNATHHPIAKQCLLAGRDVVVDKPFTTTVAEAEELVELAAARGRFLTVYQNRRYTGDFVTTRALVEQGVLGRVVLYEAHFDRLRPELRPQAWREQPLPGSGVWFDLGPHLIDQAMLLFGLPEAIGADIRIERDGAQADDAFDVTLYYSDKRALLRGSMLVPPVAASFAVHGTKGSFVKFGLDPQEAALRAGRQPTEPGWDVEPADRHGTLTTAEGTRVVPTTPSSFTRYYENVRDTLCGSATAAVSPAHALDVMRCLTLARAASERRRVLPWGAD